MEEVTNEQVLETMKGRRSLWRREDGLRVSGAPKTSVIEVGMRDINCTARQRYEYLQPKRDVVGYAEIKRLTHNKRSWRTKPADD